MVLPPGNTAYLAITSREEEPLPELDEYEINGVRAAGNQYAYSENYEREIREEANRRYIRVPRAPPRRLAVQRTAPDPAAVLTGGPRPTLAQLRPAHSWVVCIASCVQPLRLLYSRAPHISAGAEGTLPAELEANTAADHTRLEQTCPAPAPAARAPQAPVTAQLQMSGAAAEDEDSGSAAEYIELLQPASLPWIVPRWADLVAVATSIAAADDLDAAAMEKLVCAFGLDFDATMSQYLASESGLPLEDRVQHVARVSLWQRASLTSRPASQSCQMQGQLHAAAVFAGYSCTCLHANGCAGTSRQRTTHSEHCQPGPSMAETAACVMCRYCSRRRTTP